MSSAASRFGSGFGSVLDAAVSDELPQRTLDVRCPRALAESRRMLKTHASCRSAPVLSIWARWKGGVSRASGPDGPGWRVCSLRRDQHRHDALVCALLPEVAFLRAESCLVVLALFSGSIEV